MEDRESPKESREKSGELASFLDTRDNSEDGPKTVLETGHFAASCFVPISGGIGGGPVDDEEERCSTSKNVSVSLFAY